MVQYPLTATDFDRILDNFAGRQVSHTPITKTTDGYSGAETLTEGTPVTIKAYFMLVNDSFDFGKHGLVEKGDAIMLAKYADGVTKDSKITADSKTYRVKEAYSVPGTFDSTGSGTDFVYTVCNLFKLS